MLNHEGPPVSDHETDLLVIGAGRVLVDGPLAQARTASAEAVLGGSAEKPADSGDRPDAASTVGNASVALTPGRGWLPGRCSENG